jgi:hypothetical protein
MHEDSVASAKRQRAREEAKVTKRLEKIQGRFDAVLDYWRESEGHSGPYAMAVRMLSEDMERAAKAIEEL